MAKKKEMSIEEKLKDALIEVEEQPYQLPENWEWVRLGSVLNFVGGGTPSKNINEYWENGTINWATVKDIKGEYLEGTIDKITEKGFENSSASLANKGEILLITRMSPGKTIISKIETTINQDLKIIRHSNFIKKIYIHKFFQSIIKEIEGLSKGTTVKGITVEVLNKLSFPLPPLAEQNRIVEKLDSMLGKIKEAKELIAEASETFQNRRASILDRAFRGELTEKWRAENEGGDATLLLGKINEEKMKKWEEECLEAEKNGKKKPSKPKLSSPEEMLIPEEEQPYQLPENWEWVRLGEIINFIGGGTPSKNIDEYWENGTINWATVKDIKGEYLERTIDKITEKGFENSSTSLAKEEDILLITRMSPGKTIISKIKTTINQDLKIIRHSNFIEKIYIHKFFQSIIKEIERLSKGTTVKGITIEVLNKLSFPLPPLAEQEEIVKIVESLLKAEEEVKDLLDMESSIELLEKSILDKAFRGELGTGDSNDEPALEMLKRIK